MARSRTKASESFDNLLPRLEAGELQRVYVLYGQESFLIERALDLIKSKVVEPDDDMGYQTMRADECAGKTIVAAARTVPMLSERQLVVVRQADALKKDDQAVLLKYIEDPVESTCLVLLASKIDKRYKLWNHAYRNGMTFEAASLTERQLPNWIKQRAKAADLKLTPQAAQILGESTGTDLATVEDALQRLALYIGERQGARSQDVEAVVASSRVRSIFELTDALGRRDARAGLRTLDNMLGNREAPLRLLATLATHVRRLLMAAELGRYYLDNSRELASKLGIHPYAAEKVASQARRFRKQELRTALLRLAKTDTELKSARRSDRIVMEEMILDLCLGNPIENTRATF